MSYPEQLAEELARVGIRGRDARRIVLEVEDHLACDTSAVERLGDAADLAAAFAAQLATRRTRRAAVWSFAALAVVAAACLAPALAIDAAGGYPDVAAGRSVALAAAAGLLLFVAPQVSFVAGSLAVGRAFRRRRDAVVPAEEARVMRRRAAVGLAGGAAAAVGIAIYAVNFAVLLPAWWTLLAASDASLAFVVATAAALPVARAGAVASSAAGEAGDLAVDLPVLRPLEPSRRPWLLCAVVGVPVVVLAFAIGWGAEGTAGDGLVRAVPEAVVFVAAFAGLRRGLGLTRS